MYVVDYLRKEARDGAGILSLQLEWVYTHIYAHYLKPCTGRVSRDSIAIYEPDFGSTCSLSSLMGWLVTKMFVYRRLIVYDVVYLLLY